LQEAIAAHRAMLEQAQLHAKKLTCELHLAEEKAGEVDQQILTLVQETLQLRHLLNELEVAYRRCLLDSQKARDAVEALLNNCKKKWVSPTRKSWYALLPALISAWILPGRWMEVISI